MKKSICVAIFLIFSIAVSIDAQNYDRIENLADDLHEQAKDLVNRTSDDIKKGNAVTGIEIERAFTAEQLSASAKLLKRLVDDKYEMSELRSAGKVLVEMSGRLPRAGSHMSDWNKAKNLISTLDQELRSNPISNIAQPVDENNVSGRVFWTGTVDATVHLVIKGSQIKTRTLAGQTYPAGIPSFTKAMPNSGSFSIGVNKKEGRGDVKIIQQPNAGNDYTAIVEIHDEGGGAKSYTVEIFW